MSDFSKRYAVVGTGGRAKMYIDAISSDYRATGELVALCDTSLTRMKWHNLQIAERFDAPPAAMYQVQKREPGHELDDFDRMVEETQPDVVIVTSMDSTHHQYIVRAMELGCDVISEKPMTIDAEKAHAIFDAIARTGRSLRVTFNYRYTPISTTVRELLMNGVIGRPLHVNFQWVLDTYHGADYFRRWHREKDKSGGLLVHKATHHFDLVNWWLQSVPHTVYALGDLMFYGRANAERRGEHYDYARYTGEKAAAGDPFALRLDQTPALQGLYLDAEAESGYLRDRNVFGENITVEDTMSVTARYRNGTILTYSLVAYSPWEGWRVAITGDKGRLEVDLVEQVGKQFVAGQEETLVPASPEVERQFGGVHLRVFPMFGKPYEVEIRQEKGGHGGGDRALLEQLFAENPPHDPYGRAASHIDGAASILMGIAANRSIATGLPILVDDLLRLP